MGHYKVPIFTSDTKTIDCQMEVFINTNELIVLKVSPDGDFDNEQCQILCINKETAKVLVKELNSLIKQLSFKELF